MKTTTIFGIILLLMSTVTTAQTVTTFTDGTPDDAIALDGDGNIYASNFTGDSVFKFTPTGTGSAFVSIFDTPNGIDFDGEGRMYACDWNDNTIYRFTSTGGLDGSITIPGNPSGMIKAFDNDDMIYTRYSANTINRITPDSQITEISSDPLLDGPVGLAYDGLGNLYVGNYNNREIYRVLNDGSLVYVATVGDVSNLGFIAYGQGYLWGTVLGEHKIYKINPLAVDDVMVFAGSVAGGDDGDIATATFNQPNGITFNDAEDTMYVTDFGSKNLRVISGITLSNNNALKNEGLQIIAQPDNEGILIRLDISFDEPYILEIVNAAGQIVYKEKRDFTSTYAVSEISTQAWSTGIYFVRIISNEYSITKKLLLN